MHDAIHQAQLAEYGGLAGVRDDGLLASALARSRHKFAHAAKPDLGALAAAYAVGLAKNHGLIDGNKRVAFMAAHVFLGLNGHEIEATEPVLVTEGVAAGRISEASLAAWVRKRLRPISGNGE
ncbi:MAG: type II toxin-antitoxin system death-on-curing family toxin [Gemmatimonadaceae bacterium]|nr:type II toxin-antitoxin system death-on-curing family toxin [Gemmatimonadaceae bacterium]